MNLNRVLVYLKSEARARALTNGDVSAADIKNVMRSHVEGAERGGFVTKAFFDLQQEGFLRRTRDTVVNPKTGHQVFVYELKW